MKNKIYTVTAYRWGTRDEHSYSQGVFNKKTKALKEAEDHKTYRGGKYECEVLEWSMNSTEPKTILALPKAI